MTREEQLGAQYGHKELGPTKKFRDELAMAAIAGIMSRGAFQAEEAAKLAYQVADAMLRERLRNA